MPTAPDKKAVAPQVKKTQLSIQLRTVLSDAYSAVMGERYARSVSTVTLETLISEQINQIEGTDGKTAIRLNKKDQVAKVVNSAKAAITTAKSMPPDAFKVDVDSSENQENANINTPEVPE